MKTPRFSENLKYSSKAFFYLVTLHIEQKDFKVQAAFLKPFAHPIEKLLVL